MPRISRRTLLASAAALLSPLLAAARAKPLPKRKPAGRPNIVFFLADDLGYADVSCYGRPDIRTPNIDAIAARGVRFMQGYANSAVCSATRTALITGRYQYRLPVGLEEPIQIGGRSEHIGLPPSHPTLPSLLRKVGYGTTLLGKWHLGVLPEFSPLKSGYDHFFGFHGGAVDYYTHQGTDHRDDLWDQDAPIHQTGYLTGLIGDRAVEAVAGYAKAGTPFFLDVHFNAPHWPWEAPGDEAEAERMRTAPLPDYDGGTQATYRAMIERMDAQIGRVVKALEQHGLSDNTIVIFTSDNGGERFADTWPFTGRKTELLEGGLRIPMVVCWPAGLPRGKVCDQVAISMDWLPTLLAAAGAAPDPSAPPDGMNLLPVMRSQAPTTPRKLFWRYKANRQRAARDGDWKVLKIQDNSYLFNVVDDPMERANLRDRHRDVFDRLTGQWDAWNTAMLQEQRENATGAFAAAQYADHIGAGPLSPDPDTGGPWPMQRIDPAPPARGS